MSGYFPPNSFNRDWKPPSRTPNPDRTIHFPDNSELGTRLETIDWSSQSLSKFNKNFYKEHETVASRSDHEVRRIRDELNITTFGYKVPNPIITFEEANFPDYILRTLREAKFTKPTPIQSQGKLERRLAFSPQWKRHDRNSTNRLRENFGLYPSRNNPHKRPRTAQGNFYTERRRANRSCTFSDAGTCYANLSGMQSLWQTLSHIQCLHIRRGA